MTETTFATGTRHDPAVPATLFGYDVIDLLGQGAGSRIYAVSCPKTQQLYALKHVIRKTDRDVRFIKQLESEHEAGRLVSHPALRRTIDYRTSRNLLFRVNEAALVLELFDGQPLDVRPPQSMVAVVDCFITAAQALLALHATGFVHCDIKPANILVNADGAVKIIDLGQSARRGTVKKRIQGTPDYMAPEQVRCEPVTEQTDVFNLGATFYWATCGRNVPTLFTRKQLGQNLLTEPTVAAPHAINPVVPPALSSLIMECVRSEPGKRPANMGELVGRLEIVRHGVVRDQQGEQRRVA